VSDLPESLFADPVRHALKTRHHHLGQFHHAAARYAPDSAPFLAVDEPTPTAMTSLSSLMQPGDAAWIFGIDYPAVPELDYVTTLECLQMVLPANVEIPDPDPDSRIEPLTGANAHEMVTLTDLAFPGFFQPRTYLMGEYFGVREGSDLIAMGGERMALEGYTEVSGVCTHPDHRGKGLAAKLIWHIARNHRRHGITSFLHVTATNTKAVDLYLRMGFITARKITLTRIAKPVRS
jgi:GNAT superfamily N-acetyltransferase